MIYHFSSMQCCDVVHFRARAADYRDDLVDDLCDLHHNLGTHVTRWADLQQVSVQIQASLKK